MDGGGTVPPLLTPDATPRGSTVARIAAGFAAAATLISCATFTLGTVLFAPLGVLAARAIARRRGRTLARGAAWLGAVLACFVGVPLVFGLLLTKAPPGTVASVRAAMDSAQTKQKPAQLPDWLERVTRLAPSSEVPRPTRSSPPVPSSPSSAS